MPNGFSPARKRSGAIIGSHRRPEPMIGSHRRSGPTIGSHRQNSAPVAEMQQSVGNQSTQSLLDSSDSSVSYTEIDPQQGAPSAPGETVYTDPSYGMYQTADIGRPQPTGVYEDPDANRDVDDDDDLSDDDDNDYYLSDEARPVSDSDSSEPEGVFVNEKGFKMKPMIDGMKNFDKNLQRAGIAHAPMPSTTFYAEQEEQRAPYARGFDEQGRMFNKSDGNLTNTIGAKAPPAIGAKPDRHIFTMDGQGQFYTGDAHHETQSRAESARQQGLDQQQRFHHSSFLGGKAVAGAGELQVRDGTVELVSDTSGHYRPGSEQMMQTVQQLGKNNVSVEKLGVEFVGKSPGQKNMQASALELLGYENFHPDEAETRMREQHSKKDSVLSELLQKVPRAPSINEDQDELPEAPNTSGQAPVGVYVDPNARQEETVYNDIEEDEDEEESNYYTLSEPFNGEEEAPENASSAPVYVYDTEKEQESEEGPNYVY